MNNLRVGDIIITRAKIPTRSFLGDDVIPLEYGKLIYVNYAHGHCTYFNGLFNQSAWLSDVYTISDWEMSTHTPLIPVLRNI